MKQMVVRVFETEAAAATYANAQKEDGFKVQVEPAIDLVLMHLPGNQIGGWPDKSGTYVVVTGVK